jgi:hypothetical protein
MPHLAIKVFNLLWFASYDSIGCGVQNGGYPGVTRVSQAVDQKNAGLKSATLISVSSPVSQVLW